MANYPDAGAYTSMVSSFTLVGLHKTQTTPFVSIDIEYKPETKCIASLSMKPDRAAALWDYIAGHWEEKHVAVVEHNGFYSDGEPIDPVVYIVVPA